MVWIEKMVVMVVKRKVLQSEATAGLNVGAAACCPGKSWLMAGEELLQTCS